LYEPACEGVAEGMENYFVAAIRDVIVKATEFYCFGEGFWRLPGKDKEVW